MSSSTKYLEGALEYAAQGIAVLPVHSIDGQGRCTCGRTPCSSPAKHPVARLVPHGHKDATTDEDTIREWWSEHTWNVAAVPGTGGYCVLDVDPRKGEDRTLHELEGEHDQLPRTFVVRSGVDEIDGEPTRGQHYWFRLPPGEVLSKHAVRGIEIKGTGGYVVVPPSQHRSGVRYEVESGGFDSVADAPNWLLVGATNPLPTDSTPSGEALTGIRLGRRTFDSIERGLRPPEGGETHRDVAVGVSRNLRETGIPKRLALALMGQAMLRDEACLDPSSPWTEADIKQIVSSVYAAPAPDADSYKSQRRRDTSRLRLIRLQEAFQLAEQPVDWIIPGLLAAGEKAVTAGPPKSMKTWIALHLARCVASGEPAFARDQWTADRPQPVLFIQEEGAAQRWARRTALVFADMPDADFAYAHRGGFSLTESRHVEWIIEQAQAARARLLVIDPWQRVTAGVKERDESETAPAWDAVHRIASETGAAVLLLHHTKKGAELNLEAIRGSSRFAGEVDLAMIVRKADQRQIEVYLDGRDLERGDDEDGNLFITYEADRPYEMRSVEFRITTRQGSATVEAVIDHLSGCTDAATTTEVCEAVTAARGKALNRQTVLDVLHSLVDAGKVEEIDPGPGRAKSWKRISDE